MKPTEARAQLRAALPAKTANTLTLAPYRQALAEGIPPAVVQRAARAYVRAELYGHRSDLHRDPASAAIAQALIDRREVRAFLRLIQATDTPEAVLEELRRDYEELTRAARENRDTAASLAPIQLGEAP